MQCTAALAELRRGNAAAAIKRLDARVFAFPDYANSQAMADVVRALACQKAGLPDQALAAARPCSGRAGSPPSAAGSGCEGLGLAQLDAG